MEPTKDQQPSPEQPANQGLGELLASLIKRVEALEQVAHSNHEIQPNVLEHIAGLAIQRIEESINSHIG